jgi:hypothetical protein
MEGERCSCATGPATQYPKSIFPSWDAMRYTHKKNIARKTILNTVANLLMIHSKPMVSLQLSCNQVGHTPEPPSLKHLAILIMFAISYPDFSHTSNAMWQHLSIIIIMLSLSLSSMIVFYWSSRPARRRAKQAESRSSKA